MFASSFNCVRYALSRVVTASLVVINLVIVLP